MEFEFSRHMFWKIVKHQISLNPVQWEPISIRTDERTDRQADTTILIVAFRNFTNAHKNDRNYPGILQHLLAKWLIKLNSMRTPPCYFLSLPVWCSLKSYNCRSQWPHGVRRKSAVARLNPAGGHGCLSVLSVVCCQVEVSATSWSLVQGSPTDFVVSVVCDQGKPREWGGHRPRCGAAPTETIRSYNQECTPPCYFLSLPVWCSLK